jgi:hypothetical protein
VLNGIVVADNSLIVSVAVENAGVDHLPAVFDSPVAVVRAGVSDLHVAAVLEPTNAKVRSSNRRRSRYRCARPSRDQHRCHYHRYRRVCRVSARSEERAPCSAPSASSLFSGAREACTISQKAAVFGRGVAWSDFTKAACRTDIADDRGCGSAFRP